MKKRFVDVPVLPDPPIEPAEIRERGYLIAIMSDTDIRKVRPDEVPKGVKFLIKDEKDLIGSKMTTHGMDAYLSRGLGTDIVPSDSREDAATRLFRYFCSTARDCASRRVGAGGVVDKMGSRKIARVIEWDDQICRVEVTSMATQQAMNRMGNMFRLLLESIPTEWDSKRHIVARASVALGERGMACTGDRAFKWYIRKMIAMGIVRLRRVE